MKTLIDCDFKALRTGSTVFADLDAGEFIFDSEDCDFSIATLIEIANANGTKLAKEKKTTVVTNLENYLSTIGLPTMNDLTDSQKVKNIVALGNENGKTDDEMLIEICLAGIPFKQTGKMFDKAMEDGGYRLTNKKRKEMGREIMVSCDFNPATFDQLSEMMERVSKEIPDTSTSQAFAIIKSYSKEFEIELPKPPKKQTGGAKLKLLKFLASNPKSTQAEFEKFLYSSTAEKSAEIYVKSYSHMRQLANEIAENFSI